MKFLKGWHEYFISNAKKPEIDWDDLDELTDCERRLIGKSVAAFQLGEYSEGKGLLRTAEEFAQITDNEYLVKITRLFIAEEQRHALLLQKFMVRHNIQLLRRHWTDTIFRRLRKHVGFELSISVLITAEIISVVYYRALSVSTGSSQLRAICDIILSDESAHVRYESELIRSIRDLKPRIYRQAVELLHWILFAGTVTVVYIGHMRVINAGGYGFNEFWTASWAEFSNCFYTSRIRRGTVDPGRSSGAGV